jgi:hypothetical protein
MKKYLVPALAIALIGASIASLAQSTPMDHSSHGMQGMMGMDSSAMQAMQKKMSAAKTDAGRQALMSEQQKLMMEKRAHMMQTKANGHGMNGMPSNMAERRQMMQSRMGMMPM